MKTRNPVVAGRFYPSDTDELIQSLSRYFRFIEKSSEFKDVLAIVSPHAGYVYSGIIAAAAFSQVNPNKVIDNVFIIAPAHKLAFQGASIYNLGNYVTPLGEVSVNLELVNKLINESELFNFQPDAHAYEHSIEVQLPFVQYHLKKAKYIVPILLGDCSEVDLVEIAKHLEPYFITDNLFVFSSDFSHYANSFDASYADIRTVEALLLKDVKILDDTVNNNRYVTNLVTSACGLLGLKILILLSNSNNRIDFIKIAYDNSGSYGNKDESRVVGYWAISAVLNPTENNDELELSDTEKSTLLKIAHQSIENHKVSNVVLKDLDITPIMHEQMGVFVSVYINGNLRGCIGRFEANKPLHKLVGEIAIQSAFHDTRFKKLSNDEISNLQLEISVISPFIPIENANEIELGKHGVYIRKGSRSGTFLPQVATKTGWSVEEFLGYCARDKAGIGWYGWQDAELFTYTALVFKDSD